MSTTNIKVIGREQKWHGSKVYEAIHIRQQGPTVDLDQGYVDWARVTHLYQIIGCPLIDVLQTLL